MVTFASLGFFLWLAPTVVVYRLLPPRLRTAALLVFSCAFCASSSPWAVAALAAATVVAFVAARKVADATEDAPRARAMYAGVGLLVASIVGFKGAGALEGFWAPLGLSYYTFKLISYVLETYYDARNVQRRFFDLLAYATFGAQLVSGPIQRPDTFFEQLAAAGKGKLDDAQFEKGFRLILYGLLLKLLVGDRLGAFTDLVSSHPERYARGVVVAAAFTYMPRLYADFAGYTNVALGVGLLFGIEGPPNFDRPFAASNLQEYWRRWHMSLTTWLNDYVFTPLRMATRTWGQAGLVASVMINMTLIGVWHGFTWCYLVFGLFHGVLLSGSVLTLKRRNAFFSRWPRLARPRVAFGILALQPIHAIAQTFFQAPSIASAWTQLRVVAGVQAAGDTPMAGIRTDVTDPLLACWIIAVYLGAGAPGSDVVRRALSWVPNWARYGVCLLALAALTLEEGGKFIYGQF